VSFFDDEDDAIEEEPRRTARPVAAPRPRGGSTGRSGPPRRPPARDSAVERRRLVAIAVLIVVVILMILLISSCQARNTKNSLEDYNTGVSSLITQSDATGRQVFSALSSGDSGATIASDLAAPLQSAQTELTKAKDLSVPGQMSTAQEHVVLALQMRADGISQIADAAPQIDGTGAEAGVAVKQIAAGTARFYASDVTYIDYAAAEITEALHGDNIAVGGNSNIQINGGQFLTRLSWLDPSYITTTLGASASSTSGSSATGANSTTPGLHGDGIDSVAVGSNTLSPSGTNTVDGSPAPTFIVSVTDGGAFNQYGVTCSVTVTGGPSGKATITELTPGNTSTCNVPLSGTVTPGLYTVTVTISKVPLEKNLTNNTATYSVEFQ
jgi:hypothetical protein